MFMDFLKELINLLQEYFCTWCIVGCLCLLLAKQVFRKTKYLFQNFVHNYNNVGAIFTSWSYLRRQHLQK